MNVRLDLYPGTLIRDVVANRNVRVYAIEGHDGADNEVFVFEWDVVLGQPTVIARESWSSITQSRRRSRSWDIALTSGEVWLTARSGGCGCHSPLGKAFDAAGYVAALLNA